MAVITLVFPQDGQVVPAFTVLPLRGNVKGVSRGANAQYPVTKLTVVVDNAQATSIHVDGEFQEPFESEVLIGGPGQRALTLTAIVDDIPGQPAEKTTRTARVTAEQQKP